MRTCLLVPVLCLIPFLAAAQDSDNDGLSDALEAQLGMDPRHADAFELLCDDKSKAEGDKSIGRGLETAGDFTKLWFCVAAKDRYVWKIEFTQPWQRRSDVATILYVDADNHRDTGRKDKEFARGVDMMLRPDGAQMIEWPALVKTTSAAEGNVLYLVADIKLNQQDGKSVYRCWLLTQNTTKGRETDNDNMPAITVTAAGRTDRARPAVPPGHPLYYPPEAISNLAVRMIPDAPTAEVTWMTSWVCNAHVEFGPTKDMKERAAAPPAMQNHRVFIPVQLGQTYYVRVACASAEGEPKTSDIVSFKTEKFIPKGSVQRAEIPLTLSPVAATPMPFLVGIPFPRGALGSVDNMRILQDGNELPSQVECASRWPDGSVKWALVQFLTDGASLAKASSLRKVVSLEYGNAVRPTLSAPKPMAVDEGNRIVCTTGSLQVVIDKRSFRLFSELSDGRTQLIGKQPGGLYLLDAAGNEYVSAQPDEVVIEENGPVRAVVKVRGHYTAQDGAKLFEYVVRLMFYRGQSAAGGFVRIFHTFGNDNVKQTLTDIRQMGIRVPLALTEAKPRLERRQMRYDTPSVGPVVIADKGAQIVADIANLREQYPKAWLFENNTLDIQLCPKLDAKDYEADPVTSDRLYYYLRDGVYRFHSGVSKTHEIYLGFPSDRLSAEYRPWHHQTACQAPASWYAETVAAGLMTPRTAGQFDEYESSVDRNLEASQKLRDRQGEYGMLNFGDWWGERGYNWGNIEYDTQHVMLMEYLRTLDPKFFARGCEAALHNRDVDGIHYSANPRSVGQVHVHCMFHTGDYEVRTPDKGLAIPHGGFNRGHVWTRGYFDHYFLTGDRRSLEWALTVSDHLAGPLTVGFSVGNHAERDTAWPIFGVMAAYEATADPFYLNAARIMVEDVIRRQIPETGNWGFPAGYSKVEPKPIGGYAWCCGLLITSLDLYNRYIHDKRVDEVIVRAARWLVRDEWVKDKQGFRATSCPTFNAGTPAGGACWSCANAMLIAHKLTGEKQFLDLARCGFSLFIRSTQAMGKGVTQSICLGPETLWRFKQLGITSLDPSPYLSPGKASLPRYLVLWPDEKANLPVLFQSSRAERQRVEAHLTAPPGLTIVPASRTADLTAKGQEARLVFDISSALPPGETRDLTVEWKLGDTPGKQVVKLISPRPASLGNQIGLIASGEDFLGPALDKLRVPYQRLKSLDELSAYRVLLLGTQAHSIDSVGLKDGYWKLFPWIRAGGTLFLSQLNDTGWETAFLPYEVIVEELDAESAGIADPSHPIFQQPHKLASAAGVKMYDTFRLMPGDPWKALLRDSAGGPAIAEAPFGKGRILIMQPSFERLIPGADGSPTAVNGWKLFENVTAYARN